MVNMDARHSDLSGCNCVKVSVKKWCFIRYLGMIFQLTLLLYSVSFHMQADLISIVYNEHTIFTGCRYDSDAIFPAGFDPAALGLVYVGS